MRTTLRELRASVEGLTTRTVARELDVTEIMVQHWEARRHKPRVDRAIRIAHFYGVKVEDVDW